MNGSRRPARLDLLSPPAHRDADVKRGMLGGQAARHKGQRVVGAVRHRLRVLGARVPVRVGWWHKVEGGGIKKNSFFVHEHADVFSFTLI